MKTKPLVSTKTQKAALKTINMAQSAKLKVAIANPYSRSEMGARRISFQALASQRKGASAPTLHIDGVGLDVP